MKVEEESSCFLSHYLGLSEPTLELGHLCVPPSPGRHNCLNSLSKQPPGSHPPSLPS